MSEGFTCPECSMTSYHPKDVEHRYCGNCHKFFNIASERNMEDSLDTVTDKSWEEVEALADEIGATRERYGRRLYTSEFERFANSLGWHYLRDGWNGRGWQHPAKCDRPFDATSPGDLIASIAYWEGVTVEDLADQFKSWRGEQE